MELKKAAIGGCICCCCVARGDLEGVGKVELLDLRLAAAEEPSCESFHFRVICDT